MFDPCYWACQPVTLVSEPAATVRISIASFELQSIWGCSRRYPLAQPRYGGCRGVSYIVRYTSEGRGVSSAKGLAETNGGSM